MPEQRFIGYGRVSTKAQAHGLAVQRHAIEQHVAREGGVLAAWFSEVSRSSRTAAGYESAQPELANAIGLAKAGDATLLVARLDRLTRSTALLALLLEQGLRLTVAETPHASRLVLQVYAAFAEEFRLRLSHRVRTGIAAAERAGRKRNPHAVANADRLRREADTRAERLRTVVEEIRRGTPMSVPQVAAELNRRGVFPPRSGEWTICSVTTLWRRLHPSWHSAEFPGGHIIGGRRCTENARVRRDALRPLVGRFRSEGAVTARQVLARLNEERVPSFDGRPWTLSRTFRLLEKLEAAQ